MDDLRHGAGLPVAEMTTNCLTNHLTNLFDRLTLRGDRVAKSGRYKTALHFVLAHFENDLAHG